jgi:hypothetical protein
MRAVWTANLQRASGPRPGKAIDLSAVQRSEPARHNEPRSISAAQSLPRNVRRDNMVVLISRTAAFDMSVACRPSDRGAFQAAIGRASIALVSLPRAPIPLRHGSGLPRRRRARGLNRRGERVRQCGGKTCTCARFAVSLLSDAFIMSLRAVDGLNGCERKLFQMATLNQTQTLSALNITFTQLLLLMRNGQFPSTLSNDGYGGVTFDSTAITNFAALMSAAAAKGWTLGNADYPSADWAHLAVTTPGPFARTVTRGGLGSGSGLFD